MDRTFDFVIFGPIVNIEEHAVVAACLELVGSIAELSYIVTLYKSTDRIMEEFLNSWNSRPVTALPVGMLLKGRAYVGEAEDHRGKLYGEGRQYKSVYPERLKG